MNERFRYRDFYDFSAIMQEVRLDLKEVVDLLLQKELRKPLSLKNIMQHWQLASQAKRNMQQDHSLQPVVCLLSGSHTRPDITPIALNFQAEAEKDATATAIEQMIRDTGAWGYVMINEAWMLVHDDFKQEGGIPQVQPSQHSKRREAIVIGLFTCDYHRGTAVLFERRGKKIAFTKQIDMAPDMKVAGRFAEMLPPMN